MTVVPVDARVRDARRRQQKFHGVPSFGAVTSGNPPAWHPSHLHRPRTPPVPDTVGPSWHPGRAAGRLWC